MHTSSPTPGVIVSEQQQPSSQPPYQQGQSQGTYPPPGYQLQPRNGMGVAALVLGLIGLVIALIPLLGFVGIILGILALVFGLVGVGRARKGVATNKVMSWFGAVLGACAIALGIVGLFIVNEAVDQLERDLNEIGSVSAPR